MGSLPAIAGLVIFVAAAVVSLLLLARDRTYLPLPRRLPCQKLHLSFCWAPWLAACLMLACQTMTPSQAGQSILSAMHAEPLAQLGTFLSLVRPWSGE